MEFFLAGSCIVIAILGWLKYRFILNPVTSMFGMWGVILPFSSMNLYGVHNPDARVYTIIALGLGFYLVGVICSSYKKRLVFQLSHRSRSLSSIYNYTYSINYPLIYILDSIALIYYLSQFAIVFRLLITGNNFAYIRTLATMGEDSTLYNSYYIYLVKVFIAIPVTYLTIALLPLELFYGKRDKVVIIESILIMTLFVLTTGGRSVILWVAIYYACIFLMNTKHNHRKIRIPKRYRKYVYLGAVGLVFLMMTITKSRKGSDVDLLKQIFIYYVAPIAHFDRYIDVVNSSNLYGYGLSSFYGIIYPFLLVLKTIGFFSEYPEFVNQVNYMSFQMLERGTNIGGEIYMNAFVTIFYQPYLDGRMLGVISCLFIFGFLCGRSFVKAYYYKNTKHLLIYSLLLQKVFGSVVRFYFTQQAQSLAFILAFLAMRTSPVTELAYESSIMGNMEAVK